MRFLRGLLVGLAASLLAAGLFATAGLWTFRQTLAREAVVQDWLGSSGVYDHFAGEISRLADEQASSGQATSGISESELQTVVGQALTPQTVKDFTSQMISGIYDWLDGKTEIPQFSYDFTPVKQNLGRLMADNARQHIDRLPLCTSDQELPESFDPYRSTCKPTGVDVTAELAEIESDIANSQEIFANPVVNADSFKPASEQQNVFVQAKKLPEMFRLVKTAAIWVAIITVLAGLAVLFGSASHRQGIKRVVVALITTTVVVLLGALLFAPALNLAEDQFLQADRQDARLARSIVLPLLREVGKDMRTWGLIFGLLYLVLAVAGIIYLYISREKQPEKPDTDHKIGAIGSTDPPALPSPPTNEQRTLTGAPPSTNRPRPPRKIQL